MSQVSVIARIPAVPGKRAELIQALQQALDNAAGEAGTLMYVLHEDVKDADAVWFYERYVDQAALDAHSTSDGMKALGPALAGLVAGRPELTILKPVGGKGL
jgi:quinol monooxygenase YgiN